MLTANLQRGTVRGRPVADAWHHQMVFAADRESAYVCNSVENISECVLQEILCSPSVLLVRAEDVHQHWTKGCDLSSLINHTDPKWTEMNVIGKFSIFFQTRVVYVSKISNPFNLCFKSFFGVLGQILGVVREYSVPRSRGEPTVTHVAIPACYMSGITLFAPANSSTWKEISESEELPQIESPNCSSVEIIFNA